MTLPTTESIRTRSSWHGLYDLAMRICDKYGLPFFDCDLMIFTYDSEFKVFLPEGHPWLN